MKALLVGLAMLVLSPSAQAFETYEVTGVAAGDSLVLREEPTEGGKPADWKEIQRIPPDAKNVLGTGRSTLVGGQRWIEVVHGGVTGWVNLKHLQGVNSEVGAVAFQCSGTEPFWSISLAATGATYGDPEVETQPLSVDAVIVAQGRPGIPVLYRMSRSQNRKSEAVVSQQAWCSDGMSDYDYAFQVMYSDETSLRQGCCTLKR